MTPQIPLAQRIREMAESRELPDGRTVQVLSFFAALDLARGLARATGSRTAARVEREALALGVCPERYLRNLGSYSLEEQLRLLDSRVAMAGLGGLGGHALELMARAGVGFIRAADGDEFEASNLNRQLLATRRSLMGYKAAAAAARVLQVNGGVVFEPIAAFMDAENMAGLIAGAQLCVDALGGMSGREELARAAAEAGMPLVTAAVAGQTGLVATVLPGATCPAELFGKGGAAEDRLGTPAPAVAAAASIMAAEAVNILAGREPALAGKMLVFDLARMSFETVAI
jgi:molybdopterin/thiamine biosynthesis adenylyltransferase